MDSALTRLGRLLNPRLLIRGYKLTFGSPVARQHVLPDLAEFCGANDPAPRNDDLFMQGRAAGRRDVWLRIQNFLHLTDDELMALYAGRPTMRREHE